MAESLARLLKLVPWARGSPVVVAALWSARGRRKRRSLGSAIGGGRRTKRSGLSSTIGLLHGDSRQLGLAGLWDGSSVLAFRVCMPSVRRGSLRPRKKMDPSSERRRAGDYA